MPDLEAVEDVAVGPDLEEIYRRHRAELIRFAAVLVGSDNAADVVSSAVVRVLDRLESVRNPKAYLYQVVANQARNWKRGESRRLRRESETAVYSDHVYIAEPYPEVREAIEELSVRQRAVVYLTYWADLPSETVAAYLGIGTGSVRRHLARARDQLRRVLDESL